MGTYYVYVNLDKREVFNPEDFGFGIKFSEVSCTGVALILAQLLRHGGRWCGDRIALAGDDQGLIVTDKNLRQEIQKLQLPGLYQLAKYTFDPVEPGDLKIRPSQPREKRR